MFSIFANRKFSASRRKRNSSRKLYNRDSWSFPWTWISFCFSALIFVLSLIVLFSAFADSENDSSIVFPDAWNFTSAVWGRNLYVINYQGESYLNRFFFEVRRWWLILLFRIK